MAVKKVIKLKSFEIEHTNPSMGPHEKVVTISLSNKPPHTEHFHKLLMETQVNGMVSLKDYIEFHLTKNSEQLKKVYEAFKSGDLNEGETISNLKFTLETGQTIEISDYKRRYSITGYYWKSFLPVLLEHGNRTEFSGWGDDPSAIRPIERPISEEEEGLDNSTTNVNDIPEELRDPKPQKK